MDTPVTRLNHASRSEASEFFSSLLGECTPQRDLLVSACHALLVGDVLVQAGALVNGVTITREADVPERFTYHHVELSDHSLILAEGVPAETFIENVEGRWFDNWAERPAFEGRFAEAQELAYPRVQSARQLPAALRGALGTAAADLEQARAVDRPLAA